MDNQTKYHGWGKRHIFIFMSFCLHVLKNLLRNNLSVAIVAMVKQGNSKRIGTYRKDVQRKLFFSSWDVSRKL